MWLTGTNTIVTGNYFDNVELIVNDKTDTNKPIVINNNLMENSIVTHEKGNLVTTFE